MFKVFSTRCNDPLSKLHYPQIQKIQFIFYSIKHIQYKLVDNIDEKLAEEYNIQCKIDNLPGDPLGPLLREDSSVLLSINLSETSKIITIRCKGNFPKGFIMHAI